MNAGREGGKGKKNMAGKIEEGDEGLEREGKEGIGYI